MAFINVSLSDHDAAAASGPEAPVQGLRRMDQITFEMAVSKVATASSRGVSTTIMGRDSFRRLTPIRSGWCRTEQNANGRE